MSYAGRVLSKNQYPPDQVASVKRYAETVLANVKAGVEVTDLKGAQAYASRQSDVAKSVYETLVKDGKALAEIGNQHNAEVTKLVRGRVEATVKSAPVKKAA